MEQGCVCQYRTWRRGAIALRMPVPDMRRGAYRPCMAKTETAPSTVKLPSGRSTTERQQPAYVAPLRNVDNAHTALTSHIRWHHYRTLTTHIRCTITER
eukprot:147273-Rhodomonas_salina.2